MIPGPVVSVCMTARRRLSLNALLAVPSPLQDSNETHRRNVPPSPAHPLPRPVRVVSSTSEEEEALTEKFLKINCKYITDGKVRQSVICYQHVLCLPFRSPFFLGVCHCFMAIFRTYGTLSGLTLSLLSHCLESLIIVLCFVFLSCFFIVYVILSKLFRE